MGTLTKIILASVCVAFLAVKWSMPSFHSESLKGARVVVTGASTGIGEQVAYHYARFGAQIVITARREKVLQQVVEKCMSLGAQKAFYVVADMSSDSDPDKVVDFALEKLGGLDYLVLNHIGQSPVSLWKGDVEHTKWLMKVNFFSYIQMAWKAMAALEESKGSLIIVSSLLGKLSSPYFAAYSTSKFALNGFFGSLQHELAMKKSNVSTSICILGLIDTESAMEKVKEITLYVSASPATDAALNIIITGATRQSELYYPWYTFMMVFTNQVFPSITNFFTQRFYNYVP